MPALQWRRAKHRTRRFFADDCELVAFRDGESRNLVCLREELREKRFARRFKRRGVGEDGGGKRERPQNAQCLERAAE